MRIRGYIAISALAAALSLAGISVSSGQSSLSESGVGEDPEFFVALETYVSYGGDIDVIDGLTGKDYHSDNAVVKAVHSKMPKIMGGLHERLLQLEWDFIENLMSSGLFHLDKLAGLADSFGIRGFKIDKREWLKKERVILQRLRSKPFFQIEEIVVWEKEHLSEIALRDNIRAKNIRFNPSTLQWERRVLTKWIVDIPTRKGSKTISKQQGLNLDTNSGFHFSDTLPLSVRPNGFRTVPVSFPIVVSRRENSKEQIDRLERLIVSNLSYLYDPFSWGGRRNVRFKNKFSSTLLRYMEEKRYPITDREWFIPVLCDFLNDVVTVELYGLAEVYDFYLTKRFEKNRTQLGIAMDPLNWRDDENRPEARESRVRFRFDFDNPEGARFVLLDLYLRFGNEFVDELRNRLITLSGRASGRELVLQAIEALVDVSPPKYIEAAEKAQSDSVANYYNNKFDR